MRLPHRVDTFYYPSGAVGAAADGGNIRLSFRGGEWLRTAVLCLTDLWIVLEDVSGRRRVGRALVRVRKSPPPADGRTKREKSACDGA